MIYERIIIADKLFNAHIVLSMNNREKYSYLVKMPYNFIDLQE